MKVTWELCDCCWREHEKVTRFVPFHVRLQVGVVHDPDADGVPAAGYPDVRAVQYCTNCLVPVAQETLGLEFELRRAQQPDTTLGHCYRWLQEHLDALTDAQRMQWFKAHTGEWPYCNEEE